MAYTGSVKTWVTDRGFGFIGPDDGGDDIFVHFRSLEDGRDSLNIGEIVTYDLATDDRNGKKRAEHVVGDGSGDPPRPRSDDGGGRRGGRGRGRGRGRGGRRGGGRGGGRDRGYGGGRDRDYGGGRDRDYGDRDGGYGGGYGGGRGGGRDGGYGGGRDY